MSESMKRMHIGEGKREGELVHLLCLCPAPVGDDSRTSLLIYSAVLDLSELLPEGKRNTLETQGEQYI